MDIIGNWELLIERQKTQRNPELVKSLMKIRMGAFDDLRRSGHLVKVGDKPLSELAPTIHPEQRLELAGNIGRQFIDVSGDLFETRFQIKHADHFPNCIFIAIAAILENQEGFVNEMAPDKKVAVICEYDTVAGGIDLLGKSLPMLEACYPWLHLSTKAHMTAPPAAALPRYVRPDKSSLLFVADKVAKVDVMRTAFSGVVRRGCIRKGDVLNVIDGSGRVLCNEGIVIVIFAGKPGETIEMVTEGQMVAAELLLAVEIPAGEYHNICLVDGDKKLAAPEPPEKAGKRNPPPDDGKTSAETKEPKKKEGFWSKLLGKK